MNRNCYRLVFNATSGTMVPAAETARGRGKAASSSGLAGALLAGVLLANPAQAQMPVASTGGAIPSYVTAGQASYLVNGNQAYVNQVGNKAILNWQSFNVGAGNNVQFRQVDSLDTNNLVQGASFTSLNRIWDANPSVIAGSISQGAGQKANVIMVNTNGIAFMGGSQVNLNSFTASSLDLADNNFVLNSLLGDNKRPQFVGTGGFINVFEGARITAGSQGRVMLIAPTVVNSGKIEAPDGQVILAAGSKVYLRAADSANPNVRGLMVEVDSPAAASDVGHATNFGELSAPRGNVTMVGYAVNQNGIARATSSVVASGSVYLLAKDTVSTVGSTVSTRGGLVVLGANSRTEVLPETSDVTTSVDGGTGVGLALRSEVQVLGQAIYMAGSASILAPAGTVNLIAVEDPSKLVVGGGPLDTAASPASTTARVHIASGAQISVAGLTGVEVSASRNTVAVELRGDELKDSPVNQSGPLRSETVYVDIARALANADAGQSTLIAKDSLLSYQAKVGRTVAERSTMGGTVNVRSEGDAILESGVVVDLSGGSLAYTPATVKTTLLIANGKSVDISDAKADTRYSGITTRYVVDYGRWNKKEVIDLGQSYRFDPGYTEGKDAGNLNLESIGGAFMQADIQGRTTVGALQRAKGLQPVGATLTVGTTLVGEGAGRDYKLNQKVVLERVAKSLPANFGMGDLLSAELSDTLTLDSALLAKDKVANLNVYTNQAAEVRSALRAPQGGGVTIAANNLTVNADIEAAAGTISLAARNNTFAKTNDPQLRVADGVQLSARGAWVNERAGVAAGDSSLPLLDGGTISLAADSIGRSTGYDSRGTVSLGQGVTIDASGGARTNSAGVVTAGKGGAISVKGYAIEGLMYTDIDGQKKYKVSAYGLQKGGQIDLATNRIKIGGAAENAFGTLQLAPGFFETGGFADFSLTGLSTLEVAQNTVVRPQVVNRELLANAATALTGTKMADISRSVVLGDTVRQAANISLASKQSSVGTGELLIDVGARVEVEAKGKIALEARNTVDVEGALVAHGGRIDVLLDRSTDTVSGDISQNALWVGKQAVLDVSGVARIYVDSRGLTQGEVLAGGAVSLNAKTGYVVTEEGSRIDLSGAAPVRLDVLNERGGLGRSVGSDAGTLNVFAEEGILLDGAIAARGGGASNRGGTVSIALSKNARLEIQSGLDPVLNARALNLASSVSPQTAGLAPAASIPVTGVVRARIGVDKLEAAGFDRMSFSSRDAIILEDGLDLGSGRALPIRELKLDAARIETAGGNAALHADSLFMGNYDTTIRMGSDGAYASTGTLTANARMLELAGNLRLRGMATSVLTGSESVQLAGVVFDKKVATVRSDVDHGYSANIHTTADLTLRGSVIAPATYAQTKITASGKTVRFEGTGTQPTQPLSVLGSLEVNAADIVQAGNLWAPFGSINLVATNGLTLAPGSLTSVAAAPGSVSALGQLQNGSDWIVNVDSPEVPKGQIKIAALPEKAVRLSGGVVDMQAGATVDIAGGGKLQAYEFTVGPGGSSDILAPTRIETNSKTGVQTIINTNIYAILPGYKGGFAPANPQEKFDRTSGESVYLSGVPGLANGTYTLLPPHYALLPGAFAVQLNTNSTLLPGQAYTRQDGVRVAAGYVTDTRTGAPRDANWSAIAVLTREQVLARSELTLTAASDFFSGGNNLPQDAGLLSVSTQGVLKLDATYKTAAAAGGRGASVDISAPNIAITSGSPVGIDPADTRIEVATLNAFGADSLLLGATRARSGDTTTLSVGANRVTLANDAANPLRAAEVILAATDTVTLKAGSMIDAQGAAGNAGRYTTAGNGALVRAASTGATFERTGSPDRTSGTLNAEVGSVVRAADSIALDATKESAFHGATGFRKNGVVVAGNLAVGASRINFGDAPGRAEGITYTQAELDTLNTLSSLALTSYSSFDLYGDVKVGGVDVNGKPTLQSLTLQGAGLAGVGNTGKTASISAKNVTISNPASVAFVPGGALGDGALKIFADTLTLGQGVKDVQGFTTVTLTANELVGTGVGATNVAAAATVNMARIRGEKGTDQSFTSAGVLSVAKRVADRVLAPDSALGAKWAFTGTSVDFNTSAELASGQFKLKATNGDVNVGADARVNVAGRDVAFFDVSRPTWGGTAELVSDAGDVSIANGGKVDVSGAAGADGGSLVLRAKNGTVKLGSNSVAGTALADATGKVGDGASVEIDAATLSNFSANNTALNAGGFDGVRSLRARSGDVTIASTDTVRAKQITIAADNGNLDVAGALIASGRQAGRIALFAKNDVNVLSSARLDAISSDKNKDGGEVEIGSTSGTLSLASGSAINVSGGAGGRGGSVLLSALRTANDVKVVAVDSTITGARTVSVEALKVYSGKDTLNATNTNSGTTLGLTAITNDNTAFAANNNAIKARLGKAADANFRIISGVEVVSAGASMTLGADWNLNASRAGGEVGVLTLRAAGDININSNLSDGFSAATPYGSGTIPSTLSAGDSWSYRMVAGADQTAANRLAVSSEKDFTLAAGKLIRTGTGDIRIAAGRDIKLASKSSVIYTAGSTAGAVAGFTKPAANNLRAAFSRSGGDVSLVAGRDVLGTASTQLYSDWLYRQGTLSSDGASYTTQPAWWVRFDQFQQGVGALGGGDVTITAGGMVKNLSASTPTQGRMASSTPNAASLVKTGGGTVRVNAGSDVLGGQYFADNGDLVLKASGMVSSGQSVLGKPVYTILALGDAAARVQAQGDINIHTVLNPQLLAQSTASGGSANFGNVGITGSNRTKFSTYSDASAVVLESLAGNVSVHNANGSDGVQGLSPAYYFVNGINTAESAKKNALDALSFLPSTLAARAFQGDVVMHDQAAGGSLTLVPGARGDLELLAQNTVQVNANIAMSDRNLAGVASVTNPVSSSEFVLGPDSKQLHAATPVHLGDINPVHIYANTGDVRGASIANGKNTLVDLPKAVFVRAGRDVRDFSVSAQNVNAGDRSVIEAGRDVVFSRGSGRSEDDRISIGGTGRLEVSAGRTIDLGTSSGIVTRGDLDNPALSANGADIQLLAGAGSTGLDASKAINALGARLAAGASDDSTLWLARWLTGNSLLDAGNALTAVRALAAQSGNVQRDSVRSMIFTAMRETGRDANNADSGFAGDFRRGYAALELVFPGIGEKTAGGAFKNYNGDINMFASRIKTVHGGNIEFMIPGGDLIVGLGNTPEELVKAENLGGNVLGMVAAVQGDIKGFVRGNMLVNQSRILTVGGGNVLLWSSEGNIDAGGGKKTAYSAPLPVIKVDSQGNINQEQQGAAAGSGIGALPSAVVSAGDVDLIAPKGTVNAGDAGIRAGNLNIAALTVLGADNISVSGKSAGTPVADTSAVTASASGATSSGDDLSKTTAALSQSAADSAKSAQSLADSFKPTFVRVDVLGFGE